jgi:hypothetical protein
MYDCMCECALICNNLSLLTKLEHYLSGIDVHCRETYSKLSITLDKFAIIDSHDIRGAIYALLYYSIQPDYVFRFLRNQLPIFKSKPAIYFHGKINSLHPIRWMACDKKAQSSQHSKLS